MSTKTGTALVHSWGRYAGGHHELRPLWSRFERLPLADSMLPFGNGRSYGDSCLNAGGCLLDTRRLDRFMAFDAATGRLTCEAGVRFSEILAMCVPRGWFLPVTPGTQHVTLGGAIANDVHGKNHHLAGSFGCHVVQLELVRSNGQRLLCSLDQHPTLFAATIGGLGLTGLITWAEIQLLPIQGPQMLQAVMPFDSVEEFLGLSAEAECAYSYVVGWLDTMGRGKRRGRGILFCGDHAPAPSASASAAPPRKCSVRVTPPGSLVNRFTARLFNTAYFHHHRSLPGRTRAVHYERFFYPLDRIGQWSRLYGPRGMVQYQFVVPGQRATAVLKEVLQAVHQADAATFLGVLKSFGPLRSVGMMSFAREGVTLAMDFAMQDGTLALLDRLDGIVANAGGAVYPAKDARMSGWRFRQFFPGYAAFSEHVDPCFDSSFWRRVTRQP